MHALLTLPGKIQPPGLNLLQLCKKSLYAPEQNRPISNCIRTKEKIKTRLIGQIWNFLFKTDKNANLFSQPQICFSILTQFELGDQTQALKTNC